MRQQVPAFQKAIELLGRRSHFEREIERKLSQRSYEESEVEATMERLRSQGYVDDRQTAREFVRTRMARKPVGRLKLLSDLRARGVDSDVAREVLGELYPEDDLDLARQASERFYGNEARLARRLERQGFTSRSIAAVLRERRSAQEAEDEP